MQNCKSVNTPVDANSKLEMATSNDPCIDQQQYQSVIGSLMYLSVSTRPDISFAVGNLARHSSHPTSTHWKPLKRVLRYLKGTVNYGIKYTKSDQKECMGYSDADWAGDVNDKKSTSGYLFMMNRGAVTWKSKKQSCVALSTAEAEYVALSSAAQECVWLRQLISDPGIPTAVFEDNQSAIAMSRNPQFHGKADIKCHYIRDQVQNDVIDLVYCPSEDMIADIFTKGLCKAKFEKLRKRAGVGPQIKSTRGGVLKIFISIPLKTYLCVTCVLCVMYIF